MIGERISELRKRKNMTQKELATFLSVSLNSVSLYERNLSTCLLYTSVCDLPHRDIYTAAVILLHR